MSVQTHCWLFVVGLSFTAITLRPWSPFLWLTIVFNKRFSLLSMSHWACIDFRMIQVISTITYSLANLTSYRHVSRMVFLLDLPIRFVLLLLHYLASCSHVPSTVAFFELNYMSLPVWGMSACFMSHSHINHNLSYQYPSQKFHFPWSED